MAFQDDTFWTVAGAAAPVIALAAVVLLGRLYNQSAAMTADIVRTFDRADPDQFDAQAISEPSARQRTIKRWIFGLWLVQGVNLVLQCVLLAFSLVSLADHRNRIGPVVVTWGEVVGIALLAVCTVGLSVVVVAGQDLVKAFREALHVRGGTS